MSMDYPTGGSWSFQLEADWHITIQLCMMIILSFLVPFLFPFDRVRVWKNFLLDLTNTIKGKYINIAKKINPWEYQSNFSQQNPDEIKQ